MTLPFLWGFSDPVFAVAKMPDVAQMLTDAASLNPQIMRILVPWNFIAKAKAVGAATVDAVNGVPTNANRDWTTVDRYLNDMLLQVNCDILMMIGQGKPQWSKGFFGIGAQYAGHDDYQNFCAEVAARYKPGGPGIRTDGKYAPNAGKGVTKFELWNEVNSILFWGSVVDPSSYTDFLISGHAGIKSVLPGTASTVVFCGVQHVPRVGNWFGYGKITMDEITFLTRCYAAAVKKGTTLGAHFDAMAEHFYTQTDTASYSGSTPGPAPTANTDNALQLKAVHDLMVTKGDGAKPIWITEVGFTTASLSQADQSTYMQQAFVYLATLPYVTAVFICSLRDFGTNPTNPEHGWGMETYGYVHKAIWSWVQSLTPGRVQPAAGQLTLVGSHPVFDVTVSPTGGALTATGATPQVLAQPLTTVTPSPGTLALSGKTPTVSSVPTGIPYTVPWTVGQ